MTIPATTTIETANSHHNCISSQLFPLFKTPMAFKCTSFFFNDIWSEWFQSSAGKDSKFEHVCVNLNITAWKQPWHNIIHLQNSVCEALVCKDGWRQEVSPSYCLATNVQCSVSFSNFQWYFHLDGSVNSTKAIRLCTLSPSPYLVCHHF